MTGAKSRVSQFQARMARLEVTVMTGSFRSVKMAEAFDDTIS
jgi:hypothetical protein